MTDDGWTRYRDETFGFGFEHPGSWSVIPNILGCAALLLEPAEENEDFRSNITVAVEEGPDHDLDRLIEIQMRELKRHFTDYALLERGELELAGRPARYVHATYREGVFSIHLEQWPVAMPERVVALTATSEDTRRDDVRGVIERVVESFTVL